MSDQRHNIKNLRRSIVKQLANQYLGIGSDSSFLYQSWDGSIAMGKILSKAEFNH